MRVLSHFFPSATLAWYVGRLLFLYSLTFLLTLVLVLQTLDLLGESGRILAAPGNSEGDLWRYVMLRSPQLIAQFLPFAVLLSSLTLLALLHQHSEIVIFKASGMSPHQILAPFLVTAALIAFISFLFNETILVGANRDLAAWKETGYGARPADQVTHSLWIKDGDRLVHIDHIPTSGQRLDGVSVYEFRQDSLTDIVSAAVAHRQQDSHSQPESDTPKGWVLDDPRRFDVSSGLQKEVGAMTVLQGTDPLSVAHLDARADHVPFWDLSSVIRAQRKAGRATAELETAQQHKIAGPLSALLMPLLGSIVAFGLARSGGLFMRAVLGMVFGFSFFVVDNFLITMGNFGAVPPLLAGWGALVIFALAGESVLLYTEE